MPVSVVIEEGAPGVPAQLRLQQACLLCYVGKCAVAIVVKERVLPVIADEEIVVAVVVVIADAAALSPAAAREAGFRGDVRKRAFTIVFEEVAGWLLTFCESFETPAVHEKNIEPAILVVVIEGNSAAGGFEEIFVLAFAAINCLRIQAGLRCHIDKLQAKRRTFDGGMRSWRRGHGFRVVGALGAGLRLRCLLRGCQQSAFPWRSSHQQNIGERQNKRSAAQGLEKPASIHRDDCIVRFQSDWSTQSQGWADSSVAAFARSDAASAARPRRS